MRKTTIALAACAALLLLAPSVAAHPKAFVVEGASGERCYVYTNDTNDPQYWLESNGVTTGGVEDGRSLSGEGSGLQRGNGPWGLADTRLTEDEFLLTCA